MASYPDYSTLNNAGINDEEPDYSAQDIIPLLKKQPNDVTNPDYLALNSEGFKQGSPLPPEEPKAPEVMGPNPLNTGFKSQDMDPTSAALAKLGDAWRSRGQKDVDIDAILGGKPGVSELPDYLSGGSGSMLAKGKDAGPDDDEDEDGGESRNLSGKASQKAGSTAKAAQGAGESKDYLHDLLSKVYGKDMGDDAIKAAQAQRDDTERMARLSKAGSIIGAALSRGAIKPDTDIQDEMIKNAGQGVQDIMQRRQGVMQQMEAGLKASDLQDREKLRDAGSLVSQAYRNMALQLNPKLAGMPDFQHMNAEGVKQMLPAIDLSIKMQMVKDNHELMRQQKNIEDQKKAKAEMTTKIGGIMNRGAPAKAMDVDRRVDNITSLTSLYPDLNKMPQGQVNALTDEIAQIVTGGMSTEGKAAKLMNPTLASGFTNLLSKASGTPNGAQLGEFIQEYLPYMQDLQKNARTYIADQIKPIAVGYNRRVAPNDMDEVLGAYHKYGVGPQSGPQVSDQEVQQFLTANKKDHPELTPEAAKSILAQRKAKMGQ